MTKNTKKKTDLRTSKTRRIKPTGPTLPSHQDLLGTAFMLINYAQKIEGADKAEKLTKDDLTFIKKVIAASAQLRTKERKIVRNTQAIMFARVLSSIYQEFESKVGQDKSREESINSWLDGAEKVFRVKLTPSQRKKFHEPSSGITRSIDNLNDPNGNDKSGATTVAFHRMKFAFDGGRSATLFNLDKVIKEEVAQYNISIKEMADPVTAYIHTTERILVYLLNTIRSNLSEAFILQKLSGERSDKILLDSVLKVLKLEPVSLQTLKNGDKS